MICIVLAAGYGTRLYPLSKNTPKPLLELRGKPLLDWLLQDLEGGGHIDCYIVITNNRFTSHFERWRENRSFQRPVIILNDGSTCNENRLGAVRDIALAVDSIEREDDLLVLAGDSVLDFSLNRFIEYFDEKQGTCIMRYWEPSPERLRRTGVVTVDDRDQVLSMIEKPQTPQSSWAVPPFYLYRKEDVPCLHQAIRDGCQTDAPGEYIAWLHRRKSVYAMEMPGKRYDIGNMQSYMNAKNDFHGVPEEGA